VGSVEDEQGTSSWITRAWITSASGRVVSSDAPALVITEMYSSADMSAMAWGSCVEW